MKKDTLIEVAWRDIVMEASWLPESVAAKRPPMTCKSVGYFLNRDDGMLRMSASVTLDKERDVLVIPEGVIVSIRELDKGVKDGGRSRRKDAH